MTDQTYDDGDGDGDTMTATGQTEDLRNNNAPGEDAMSTDRDAMSTDRDAMSTDGDSDLLFDERDAASFRQRWEQVQSRFVDDPRAAVADADSLVSDVTQSLTTRFADQRGGLEQQWSQGEDVQTEDLRQTMQRYRALFERLLAA